MEIRLRAEKLAKVQHEAKTQDDKKAKKWEALNDKEKADAINEAVEIIRRGVVV